MDSNTHSTKSGTRRPDELATVAAGIDQLAAEDLDRLPDAALAEQTLALRQLLDRLDGHWLQRLAAVDGRGAAGAEANLAVGSTAAWLRGRLRMGASAASSCVRTARALFRGPLTGTARAVCAGELSPAHAQVLAQETRHLPAHVAAEAEPVLVAAARRLDPPRLRRAAAYLCQLADPDGAEADRERRHSRRGLWLSPTVDGMVAVDGLLEPESGQTLQAALEPLARRHLESGRLPKVGGVRPQLAVVVDLDSLLSRPGGGVGGETGWAGPLDRAACRRLACDGVVTRVLVSRHPSNHRQGGDHGDPDQGPGAAGPPSGRVISPAQRTALAVRDGGCVFPDCARPLSWCGGHHLVSWLDGGPTDLANLALLCRTHHRAVHEGGWRLTRASDGRVNAIPPHRRHRRHPGAASGSACSTTTV